MPPLQKKSNPAATAVNNAVNHDREAARQSLHDDSGATTGLRMQPDYGESDSYTTEMNEANSKGAAAGYIIAVESPAKTAASGEMYVSSVEFHTKDAARVEKFAFTADRGRALVSHRLTAQEIARQINSPAFGATAHIVLAYNYEDMFKAVLALVPKSAAAIKAEIAWAKQALKKQDRIVWFLRWYRIALVENLVGIHDEVKPIVQPSKTDAAAPAPRQQPQVSIRPQLEKLFEQCKNELLAKRATWQPIRMEDLPGIKRSLEHYYSLPVPEIQNRVLTVETWDFLREAFSFAEQEWQEQATSMLRPHQEDKIFMQFPDGWAWWWLPRASCSEESKAMGHCGNSPAEGKKGISILSLRESKAYGNETLWYPHLTFILHGEAESGYLGEMKGRNNAKPVAKYHPYIVSLLKDKRITKVVGGGYLPAHNFKVSDLSPEMRTDLAKVRPDLASVNPKINEIMDTLELSSYDEQEEAFLVQQWDTAAAFLGACGLRDAADLYDGSVQPDAPTTRELIEILNDNRGQERYNWHSKQKEPNPDYLANFGYSLLYENIYKNPGIIPEGYDPEDKDSVEEFLDKLTNDGKSLKDDTTRKQIKSGAIQNLIHLYYLTVPGKYDAESELDGYLDYVGDHTAEYTKLDISGLDDPVRQLLPLAEAEGLAADVEAGKSVPDWDRYLPNLQGGDWAYEHASNNRDYLQEKLDEHFGSMPVKPKNPYPKGQRRLFPDPQTDETAKRHGITISSLKSPLFSILAYNYEDMFKAVESLAPKTEVMIRREITWAKQALKKQDRIVWYLRWYRLALVDSLIQQQGVPGTMGQPQQASKQADATGTAPAPQPQAPKRPMSLREQLEKLLQQYKKEMQAKGATAIWYPGLGEFPAVHRQLEHSYSLPIPDIQNKVLAVENFDELYDAFGLAEQEWKEQATRMLRPHQEDTVFMQFPDGWAWWHLPRAACDDESKAMGHCGNSPRRDEENVSILSLREPKRHGKETLWYPHLTFILNGPGDSGVLGEMKGRNNDKPTQRYHPYIVALLKDERIKGVVGGGYRPANNFAMTDLNEAQRREIAEVNPNIGLTIADYYAEHGMDDDLAARIRTVLELPQARYDNDYGFIIHEWKNTEEFVNDCGDREAKDAWRFAETGESAHDTPDGDEMSDLLDDTDEAIVYHVGLALQYHYARELKQWYRNRQGDPAFDPRNVDMVKQAIQDIYKMYVELKRNAPKEEPAAKGKKQPSPYRIPVIQEFWWSYIAGGPDQESVGRIMDDNIREAMSAEGASIEYDRNGILQAIPVEQAVQVASKAEAEGGRRRADFFEKPSLSIPYDWDDWDGDRAAESLRSSFDAPPKRPDLDKQKRLFREPKTEEDAKRRGITISKVLKNQLFHQ